MTHEPRELFILLGLLLLGGGVWTWVCWHANSRAISQERNTPSPQPSPQGEGEDTGGAR